MELNPYHLRTRIGMAGIFASGAPTAALGRVLREGDCTMLGEFSLIQPSGKRGWICRVSTRNGVDRFLAILLSEVGREYRITEIEKVPWEHWQGTSSGVGWSPSSGDTPWAHAELHRIAVGLSEALNHALSDPPFPRPEDSSDLSGVANTAASRPDFRERVLTRFRRRR